MKINNVLIVEDDIRIANILSKTISKENCFEVIGIAESSSQATDLLDCFSPELVLLDVSLVDSNGLDVLKYIRKNLSSANISVVMLTAAKDTEVIQEAMSFGAFDYILKPIAFSRLQATLNRFIQYTDHLETNQSFEQNDLDSLFHNVDSQKCEMIGKHITQKESLLPKGVDSLTLSKVRLMMRENTKIKYTAESMSECIGTSRTTARRYLEYLLNNDEIVADIEYGAVGRPERNYILK
jgi:response regulator of citrate/malate metabolism